MQSLLCTADTDNWILGTSKSPKTRLLVEAGTDVLKLTNDTGFQMNKKQQN